MSRKSKKYLSAEEIRQAFINNGWSADITFTEVTETEARENGYTFMLHGKDSISNGHKYFKMDSTGNIFHDNGKIALYNC